MIKEGMENQPNASFAKLARLKLTPGRAMLLVALASLTILLLLTLGGGRSALDALTAVKPGWILLALLVHYSGFAIRGLRWQQLLQTMGHQLSWRACTTLLLSGWFVSALLPARAGDLLRIGALRMEGRGHKAVTVADGLGSILLERVLDLLALICLGATVGLVVLRAQLPTWVLMAYGIGLVGLAVVGTTLLAAPTLLTWLQQWTTAPLWQKLLAFVAEVVAALRSLGSQPRMAFLILLESLYIWFCDALLMWFVLHAMGVVAPLASITFVALTVDIFAAIPITPGGIGQIEAVNVALLALLPLPPFNVAAAVLLNRAISYWTFLIFSGVITFAAGLGQLVFQQRGQPQQPTSGLNKGREDEYHV